MSNALNIRLVLDGDQFRAELRNSSGEVERFAATAKQGGDTAASSFSQTQRAATSLLAVIGGVAAIRAFTSSFIDAADVQGRMASQVQRVTRSQGEYNATMSRMREIADGAYLSINAVSEIYIRSIEPMRQLGRSTKDTLDLTEAMSLALVVSSANAEKQSSAINALSKVMQTGKVGMEDMMSLIIASPRFVEALEAALGKTRAQLLEMVSAGKLTAAEITAISSQIGLLRAEVEAMPTELVDAMVRLKNGFQEWAGQTNAQLGLTAKLVVGVEALTANFDTLASVTGSVAVATVMVFGGRALSSLAAYAATQRDAIIASSAMRDMERLAAAEAVRAAEARVVAARQTEVQVASQLRLVRSAVASAEAQHALAASNLVAAQRHADAARGAGAQSFALRELAIAETRLAAAEKTRTAAYASLAGLDAAAARMQRDLAVAQGTTIVQTDALSAAKRRLAGALTGVQAAMAAVGRAGSAVFTAMGGWVTVALAAAYGVYKLGDALFNGSSQAQDATDALRRVNDEMQLTRERADLVAQGVPEALTGVALAAKNAQDEIAGASERMHEFGAVDVMPVVAMWNAIANQIRQSGIDELQAEIDTFTDSLIRNTIEADDFSAAYQKNLGVLRALGGDTTSFIQKLEGLAITFGRTATEANTLANATSAFSESTEKFLSATYERVVALGLSQEAMIRHRAAQAAMNETSVYAVIAINKAADAEIEAIRVNDQRTRSLEASKKATEDRIKAAADYIASLQTQVTTYGLVGTALQRQTSETLALTDAQRDQETHLLSLLDEWERYAPIVQRASSSVLTLQDGNLGLTAQVASLRGQLQGLTPVQLEFNAALAEANALYLQALAIGPPTAEAQAAYELRLKQLTEIRDIKNEIDSSERATRAAEESARAWTDFASQMVDAMAKGTRGMTDLLKRMLADWARQLATSAFLRGLASLFGGNFAGLAQAAGGNGGGSLMGTLFSSFVGSGSGGSNPWLSMGSNALGLGAAGGQLGSGIGGWMQYQGANAMSLGGAGGAAPAWLGALTGYGQFGTAAGWTYAASAGPPAALAGGSAASGASAGAAGGSSLTAATAIPIIGWIIAGMLANEAAFAGGWRGNSPDGAGNGIRGVMAMPGSPVTGDQFLQSLGMGERLASLISGSALHTRLWGLRQPVVTGSNTALTLGPDGPGGYSDMDIYRKGGLFRSSRRYTERHGLTDEATAAVSSLFNDIEAVIAASALQLRGGAVGMLDAALRIVQENDTKGRHKATRYFLDVLGQSFEFGSEEEAITALYGEAIIHAIDRVLGVQVPAGIAAIDTSALANPITGMLGDWMEGMAESVGPPAPASGGASAMQGEASAIAQRWRGDATALAEGAQTLLAIVTDMRNGFDLLGTGTLTPIVTLLDDVAVAGETLYQTYQRVRTTVGLLDAALAMSGVSINATRESVVRLAVDVVDAVGGLDRAGQLFATYFSTFFSVQEQAEYAFQQAQAQATARLAGTGFAVADFEGGGGLAEFRAAFNAVLAAGDASAIATWLEAAEAIAQLLAAEQQLADARGDSARDSEAIAALLADLKWDDYVAGLSDLDRQLAESAKRYRDAAAAAAESGARESELAEIRRLGARDAQRIRDEAAAELGELLEGLRWDDAAAGMSALDRQLAQSTKEFESHIAAAIALGASEADLLEIRELGAAAAGRIILAAAAAELEALAAATERYQGLVSTLQDELNAGRLSPFQVAVRDIVRWSSAATAELEDAARAAGMAAAAESDLDLVRQVATQRLAEAVRQLRDATRGLVEQLQGSSLQQIEQQIAAAQSSSTSAQIGAIDEVGQAAAAMWERQRAAIEGIQDWLDGQMFSNDASATWQERLAEAQSQFNAAAAAAAGGDADALASLPGLADLLRGLARNAFASGDQFESIEAAIIAAMQSLAGLDIGAQPGAAATQIAPSPELIALYEQRDALLLQLEQDNRLALAQQITIAVRDLVAGTGDSLADVAASIGLSMAGLVADLGIDLGKLNADTALALGGVAQSLGVDLAALAATVGVDLGSLADRQSLLNQALDGTLAGVPEDIRAQLLGPLDALRGAVTDTDVSDAMFDLLALTDTLPNGIRDLLAPFFAEIDPTPVITELGTLRDLYDVSGQQLAESIAQTSYLQSIAAAMNAANVAAGLPAYELGTGYVPSTGPAVLHKGEMVLPAPVAAFANREGLQIGGGGGDSTAVVRELQKMAAAADARAHRAEARAERDTAESRAAIERLTAELRRTRDALTAH